MATVALGQGVLEATMLDLLLISLDTDETT